MNERTLTQGLTWRDYVRQVIGDDRQVDVARKTGVDQTTISRWLNPDPDKTRRISERSVADFARGYGRPVLEAFVVAELLTEEEASVTVLEANLGSVPTASLAYEFVRRLLVEYLDPSQHAGDSRVVDP